jgi:hypothetical protein
MTYVGNNSYGLGIYYIDYDLSKYSYIIFNNNCSQTVDIPVDKTTNNAYYLGETNSEGKYTVGTWAYYDIPASNLDNHHWNSGIVTKSPTCTEVGYRTYTCLDSGCGETKVEIIPATGHTWNSGVETKAPTESTPGEMNYTCTVCGETKVEAIPVLAHTHNPSTPTYTWSSDHLTCEATVKCSICGEALEYESVAASYTVTKAPTCLATGKAVYTTKAFASSSFTTQTYTATLPKSSHTLEVSDAITLTPTCEHSGISTHTVSCSVCGEVIDQTEMVLVAIGHNYDTSPIVVAPTRTSSGSATYTCSICGETKVKTIEALGTNGVYFTNNKGWSTVCVYIYNSDADKLTPKWPGTAMTYVGTNSDGDGIYYYAYNINAYKYIIFINGNNGQQTEDISVDRVTTNAYYCDGSSTPYGGGTWSKYSIPSAVCDTHTWNAEVTTPATSTTEGVRTYTCTVCGETYTEIIPMTGHSHNYSSEYSYSSAYYFHECLVSGCNAISDKDEHDFELVYENDKYYNVCSISGYIDEVTIAGLKIHYHRADNNYTLINSLWL